jgi:uncharacterized protein YkwD
MKKLLTLINCILLGGLLCACVAPPPPQPTPAQPTLAQPTLPPQPTPDEIAEKIIVQINAEREALGLEPFVVNEHLMLMAKWRSQDMVDGDYYSHTPPDGHPTLRDFCEQLGYDRMSKPAENLMYTEWSSGRSLDDLAEFTVNGWRGSHSHWFRAMSPDDGMTGVGIIVGEDRIIVTQLFWFGGLSTPSTAYLYNRDAP